MRVRYTALALAELEDILDYIALHSPRGVRRVQARLQAVIDLLSQFPGMGSTTDDPSIRRMTTPPYPYLIFYEPTETEVIIHAIRHAARDPSDMPGH